MNENETTKKVIDALDRTIPCPFCGEDLYKTIYPTGTGYSYVMCDTCGGQGGLGKTEAEAVDKWNKRA
jgi:Lar family restriction alleviation protein